MRNNVDMNRDPKTDKFTDRKRPVRPGICLDIWNTCDKLHSVGLDITAATVAPHVPDAAEPTVIIQVLAWRKSQYQ